ncbi:Hypothetical predicted protein [Cloeon dipterum]|uniref:Uncharacterized protein n=1 Tax=Cloeon dipterum TaxID=197152 RepID=A0A8S1CKT0_9INSE|nr:Hypothetical predicted protein [Cloeon dipterum]
MRGRVKCLHQQGADWVKHRGAKSRRPRLKSIESHGGHELLALTLLKSAFNVFVSVCDTMALQIFGVPLMGTMFVPVLSVFILLFVVSQFVAADSRASAENASKLKRTVHTQETSPTTTLEKQRNAEETSDGPRLSESSSQLTGDSSGDDSNGTDIKKKKKKKSCCGTKGACCKSKKKNSDSEVLALNFSDY